jgi:hypothetical protein
MKAQTQEDFPLPEAFRNDLKYYQYNKLSAKLEKQQCLTEDTRAAEN